MNEYRDWIDFTDRGVLPIIEADEPDAGEKLAELFETQGAYYVGVSLFFARKFVTTTEVERDSLDAKLREANADRAALMAQLADAAASEIADTAGHRELVKSYLAVARLLTERTERLTVEVNTYREALEEIADDHEPEPLVNRQLRNWCRCGNWAPHNCTAAIARRALGRPVYPEVTT